MYQILNKSVSIRKVVTSILMDRRSGEYEFPFMHLFHALQRRLRINQQIVCFLIWGTKSLRQTLAPFLKKKVLFF